MITSNTASIVEMTGTPVTFKYGVLYRGLGKTSIALKPKHLVEQTQNRCLGMWFGSRHCEIALHQIDSVEIVEQGNQLFLILAGILGVASAGIPLFILGTMLCLMLYFLLRNRFLVVRSSTNAIGILIDGDLDMDRAKLFMQEIIQIGDHPREELRPTLFSSEVLSQMSDRSLQGN
ncbi:MAG: hypothetical protein HC860_17445 [Alkalinema sp. RU_4_3]|nr:hypothetical protein [Alkalinema sp. RU_4_3]